MHLDRDMPIAGVFYEHVERLVHTHDLADSFLRLDDDGELFAGEWAPSAVIDPDSYIYQLLSLSLCTLNFEPDHQSS
jgi:hypothetical protein